VCGRKEAVKFRGVDFQGLRVGYGGFADQLALVKERGFGRCLNGSEQELFRFFWIQGGVYGAYG